MEQVRAVGEALKFIREECKEILFLQVVVFGSAQVGFRVSRNKLMLDIQKAVERDLPKLANMFIGLEAYDFENIWGLWLTRSDGKAFVKHGKSLQAILEQIDKEPVATGNEDL